jgi:diguanylate cyclase (GGDEF)-like protein
MDGLREHHFLDIGATYLERWPAALVKAVALASIPVFGLVDYLSGPDVAFSVFYLIPLSALAWVSGRDRVLIGASALLSAVTWLVADLTSGAEYDHVWVSLWNTGTRLAVFLVVVGLLANLRETLGVAQRLAQVDYLTGVANSRTFYAAVDNEIQRSRRTLRPLSLAYADVDDFKSINDAHGHAGGDRVLQHLARTLDSSTRAIDVVGRLGGDEFGILLPETNADEAARAIEAISRRVREHVAELGFPVTFSLGCVTFLRPPAETEEMVHAADQLMYEAKKSGKDTFSLRVLGEVEGADA